MKLGSLETRSELDDELIFRLKNLLDQGSAQEYLDELNKELIKVVTMENNEALGSLSSLPNDIFIDLVDLKISETNNEKRKFLRVGVIEKLIKAQRTLPKGIHLLIRDAFRSEDMVWEMYRLYLQRIKETKSGISDEEANLKVRMLLAMPDDVVPPGHMTGGAVDVVLSYTDKTRVPMEIASELLPREKQMKTHCEGLSEEVIKNRKILLDAMEAQGFHNYSGEYWHYSYGDSYWAVRRKNKIAMYGIPKKNNQ